MSSSALGLTGTTAEINDIVDTAFSGDALLDELNGLSSNAELDTALETLVPTVDGGAIVGSVTAGTASRQVVQNVWPTFVLVSVQDRVLPDEKVATTSTFTGGGGSFKTTGFDPTNHSLLAGVGLTFEDMEDFNLKATYDMEHKDDYISHSALIRAEWKF